MYWNSILKSLQVIVIILLDNGSGAFRNAVCGAHCEYWLNQELTYLTDCDQHKRGLAGLRLPPVTYQESVQSPANPHLFPPEVEDTVGRAVVSGQKPATITHTHTMYPSLTHPSHWTTCHVGQLCGVVERRRRP